MFNPKECCEAFHKYIFKIPIILLLLVLIVFIGGKTKNEIQNRAKGVENVSQRTITVSADGKVFAKPNIGEINLGVTNEAKTVSEAQKLSTKAINKTVAFLKSLGVAEKDIKTVGYYINPVYDYYKGKQTLRGYEVGQKLGVKIRDLSKSGNIIAGAAENGSNITGGLNFTIDDPDALKVEARKQAIVKAKVKAEKLASDLGVKIGKLINFSENGEGVPRLYYAETLGAGAAPAVPEIPTGENEITVSVNLTYEIR
jgi:hypothetical protein